MEEENKVSIVVPVYNVEKYLRKCIESIRNQTYQNIEIIVVNDGTKDGSLEIAKEQEKIDNRIKIISQENQGLSEARNTGIRNATGKYICFIDSDDFVHENYVKSLLENAIKENADISVCDFYYINEEGKMWNQKNKEPKLYSNIEGIKDILLDCQNTEVMTWNKLYKLSLFREHEIYFPKGKIHEDNFTTYRLYYFANKISFIPDKLYYYLQRSNSIMGKKFNVKRLDILQAVEETRNFFQNKNINLSSELDYYEIMTKIGILNNMLRDGYEEKENMINEIHSNKKVYQKNKYLNMKTKLALNLIRDKAKLYAFLLSILDNKKNKKIK